MKVTDILHEQHNEVRALFKRITSHNGHDGRERNGLVDQLISALQVHTRLEESIFYPALRELDTKKAEETVLESYEEHNIVDFILGGQAREFLWASENESPRWRQVQTAVERRNWLVRKFALLIDQSAVSKAIGADSRPQTAADAER